MAESERPILFAARVQNKNFHPRTFLRALSGLWSRQPHPGKPDIDRCVQHGRNVPMCQRYRTQGRNEISSAYLDEIVPIQYLLVQANRQVRGQTDKEISSMLNPIKYLAFRAKMEPEKLALCDFSSSLDFGRLFLFVKRIAKKLEAAGVKPGDLVVTCLPRSFDWVFTNALFHEACITCSNLDHHTIDPRLQADWVISAIPIPTLPEGQGLVVDRAWLQNALKGEPSSVIKAYASEDDLCRLILTSGSTGGAKAVPYSLKMLDERLTTISSYWSAGRNEMNLMGLSSVGGFFTALNSSFVGEPFYCPASADSVRCANQFKITSLIGSPAQLAGFAKQVETSPDGIPRVQEIRSAGGALSEALVQQLRRLFDAKIYNVYGSTEVGGACCDLLKQPHHLAHAGYVLPIGDVQIVDELDQVQPFDTEGIIRVWTSSMANEYFNNPEATATSFKEGWFYPGDGDA